MSCDCFVLHTHPQLLKLLLPSHPVKRQYYGPLYAIRVRLAHHKLDNGHIWIKDLLTNPNMNIIGHITLEMASTSSWSLLLKSDKTVGMRLMKRPIITTRPDKSFSLDGFLRTMRILEENKTKQKNRWDLSALFLTSVGPPLPSAGASVHKLLFPFRLLFA